MLEGVQGDQDFIRILFRPDRFWAYFIGPPTGNFVLLVKKGLLFLVSCQQTVSFKGIVFFSESPNKWRFLFKATLLLLLPGVTMDICW